MADYISLIRATGSNEKLTPFQGDADVAGHAVREIDDLASHPVATRLEIFLKKLKELFRQPGQRLLPAGFILIDGASVIGAQFIGKSNDEHFG